MSLSPMLSSSSSDPKSGHNTTLHKAADQGSFPRGTTVSPLDGNKGERKDKGWKGSLREKRGKSQKEEQRKWKPELSYISGYNYVSVFLLYYFILPLWFLF